MLCTEPNGRVTGAGKAGAPRPRGTTRKATLVHRDDATAQLLDAKAAAGPVGPLLYRFHEITQVNGTTLKALVNEKFGEGTMGAIDFEMSADGVEDPGGDRVRVTLNRHVPPLPEVVGGEFTRSSGKPLQIRLWHAE